MQDCLQVVSLPRILAVKQLQELDGEKEHRQMKENQNQTERWQIYIEAKRQERGLERGKKNMEEETSELDI